MVLERWGKVYDSGTDERNLESPRNIQSESINSHSINYGILKTPRQFCLLCRRRGESGPYELKPWVGLRPTLGSSTHLPGTPTHKVGCRRQSEVCPLVTQKSTGVGVLDGDDYGVRRLYSVRETRVGFTSKYSRYLRTRTNAVTQTPTNDVSLSIDPVLRVTSINM